MEDKKGEGTFSEVMICERRADGVKCAVKRMKANFSRCGRLRSALSVVLPDWSVPFGGM